MQILKLAAMLGIERAIEELECFKDEFYKDINRFKA